MGGEDSAMAGAGDDKVTFQYVFIPADTSQPLQQRELTTTRADECGSLLDELKRHYRREQKTSDASREAHRQALLAQAGANAGAVPEAAISAALNMQMVESIPLLHNTRENGHIAVNMYSDDQASFKRAPRNPRATDILLACGGSPMDVLGDVFIGRLFDDEDNFKRLDFTLDELRSDAPWAKQAAAQAAARRERAGQTRAFVERMRGSGAAVTRSAGSALPPPPPRAPPAAPSQPTPAEAAKARGNDAFKRGDWQAAADAYSEALSLEPSLAAARNNRALALLKLGRDAEAEADCSGVLDAEPGNVKALLRRAAARAALGRGGEAAGDLREALRLQPQNKEAAAQLAALGAAGEPAGGGAGGAGEAPGAAEGSGGGGRQG